MKVVSDVVIGVSLVVLCLMAAEAIREVLELERDRRERSHRPQLVVPPAPEVPRGVTGGGDGPPFPAVTPSPSDELAPSLYLDDEIAATVRRVHLDGSL